MAGLEAAAGNFSQHRSKKECVRFADQSDGSGRIRTQLLLEAFGGAHSSKATTKNDNVSFFCRRRRVWRGLWSQYFRRKVTEGLGQQTDCSAVDHPTDKNWKMCAYLFGAPFGR